MRRGTRSPTLTRSARRSARRSTSRSRSPPHLCRHTHERTHTHARTHTHDAHAAPTTRTLAHSRTHTATMQSRITFAPCRHHAIGTSGRVPHQRSRVAFTSCESGLTPATSVPGLGSPLPHLHRDWAGPAATAAPKLGVLAFQACFGKSCLNSHAQRAALYVIENLVATCLVLSLSHATRMLVRMNTCPHVRARTCTRAHTRHT